MSTQAPGNAAVWAEVQDRLQRAAEGALILLRGAKTCPKLLRASLAGHVCRGRVAQAAHSLALRGFSLYEVLTQELGETPPAGH